MATFLICDGAIDSVNLTCSTGWVVAPVMDISGLIELLTFDPAICALLIGICVLFFVIGHSAGHVARNLGRV